MSRSLLVRSPHLPNAGSVLCPIWELPLGSLKIGCAVLDIAAWERNVYLKLELLGNLWMFPFPVSGTVSESQDSLRLPGHLGRACESCDHDSNGDPTVTPLAGLLFLGERSQPLPFLFPS